MNPLQQEIYELSAAIEKASTALSGEEVVEEFRLTFLSRKGRLALCFDALKTAPPELKPELGKTLNVLRKKAEAMYETAKQELEQRQIGLHLQGFDLTLPGREIAVGHRHILSKTIDEISSIFKNMGFSVARGPEIETDYYNFKALNFADDHPARDMQDTFFIDGDHLLRTHTTPVQIRIMEKQTPPIRAIFPGRVFRNEVVSARSHLQFHQIDGLYIDAHVTFADLKGTLVAFAKQYYGTSLKYRFRTSYFPFTEPSAEMDITCYLCAGQGCKVCKSTGWLEILGCGMVDPNVYSFVRIDPDEFSGYAFGIGIERTAMLRYGFDDIRLLFENDLRINHQFN
jgi:phenylalanyl-tRNA synthetase alpha chain